MFSSLIFMKEMVFFCFSSIA